MQRFTTRSLILFYGSKISCFCEGSSSSRGGCWVEMPWISCREKSQRQNSCHWTSSQDHPPPPYNITPFTIPSSKSTDLQHQCHHQQQQRCLEDLFCIYAFLTESDPLKCLIILIKWQNWRKKLNKNHHYDPNHHLTNTSYHARADSQRFHVRYPATWDATLVLWHRIIVSKLYFHCICVVLPSTFAVTLSVCHFSQFLPSVTFSNSHVQSSCTHSCTHMSRVVAARRTLRHKWPENRHRALWEISPLLFLRILLKKIHSNKFKL